MIEWKRWPRWRKVRECLKWYEGSVHIRPFWWRLSLERMDSLLKVCVGPVVVKLWYVSLEELQHALRK